ncbi:uracil-DNA glycosylase, partial [Burkholderia diffusa]
MATRKTLRTPQQASLFDDPVPETAQDDVSASAPAPAAAGRRPAKKAAAAAPASAAPQP